jgi:microcin C transport system substrate-binding protein
MTPGGALAEEARDAPRHGLSTFGDLALPSDFRALPYADPAAPKGGAIALQIAQTGGNQAFDTFNTLNIYVLKGDGAAGMPLVFDSLMARNFDEPDAVYGLAAESVAMSADGLTQTYRIRPQARFHDGSRLTAADAAFSLLTLRDKGHPLLAQPLRHLAGADAPDDATLVVHFSPGRSRDLPLLVATMPLFSRAYYTAHEFDASSLEPPLGSGPYRVGRFEQGRFIEFERVADYWGADLPVNRGRFNFDRVRYEYFRDRQVALEGFKARTLTFREEFTSRDWSLSYDFPAVKDGRVVRVTQADATPSGAQGWWFNLRRPQFADRRVRDALGLLFDFEWTNQTIMFGQYARTTSLFENSDNKAVGKPSPAELALLEPLRGKVPDEVFGDVFVPPVSDGTGQDRALLRRADALLREAGCRREGNVLRRPDGQPFGIEFLDYSASLQPHTGSLIKNLKLLGIEANYRVVDPSQYQRRTDSFDFDIVTRRLSGSPTPGEDLRLLFGSAAASFQGSMNIGGVALPAVDRLIEAALAADTRPELMAACRCLDRVLRAERIWIPMWYKASNWLAYWDMFGHPAGKPKYDRGIPDTWWYDAEKARRING